MTDKNNSGFGAGFLGDALKDLQKEYLGTGPGKSKGKKKKTPSKAKQTEKEPEFAEVPSAVPVTDYHPGDLIMDTYHVESEAIRGGMGAVWRVNHTGWDTDLAMKRPKDEAFRTQDQKSNFEKECRYWINLGLHPNIVSCYYVREIDGIPAIFSEWMENGDLEHHIRNRTLYQGGEDEVQKRLLDIAIQFARGLKYAHDNKLVHQDVKPDNLLLTNTWQAKVSDFGITRARSLLTAAEGEQTQGEADANANANATLVAPGGGGMTPAYCSPEQAAHQKLTHRTDIYSWAVSVLEMYLGDKPWAHGRDATGPLAGIACRDYFDMCTEHPIPNSLQELLVKCLEQVPDDRPRDFGEVESALVKIYLKETGEDYPRPVAKAAPDNADSLNNHALSFLDLGRAADAEKLWTKAALLDPANTDALFNRCLHGLRSGSMALTEAQCYLYANWDNHSTDVYDADSGLLLAALSREGGDRKTMNEVLDTLGYNTDRNKPLSDEAFVDLLKDYAARGSLEDHRWLRQLGALHRGPNEATMAKIRDFTARAEKADFRCVWRLSRIRSLEDLDNLQIMRDDQLEILKEEADKGHYGSAAKLLTAVHQDHLLGDVLYEPEWMEFYRELTRHCMPVHILAQWPVLRIPDVDRNEKVSFSDDSGRLLVGQRLYDMGTGELISDNREGARDLPDSREGARDLPDNREGASDPAAAGGRPRHDRAGRDLDTPEPPKYICSRLSPDGTFYVRAEQENRTIRIVDAGTGAMRAECVVRLEPAKHTREVTALAISRDGQRLATGDAAGMLNLWTAKGKYLDTFAKRPRGPERIEDIHFGFNNNWVTIRFEDYIMLYDEADRRGRIFPYDSDLEIDVDLTDSTLAMASRQRGLGIFDLRGNGGYTPLGDRFQEARGHGIAAPDKVCFLSNMSMIAFADGKELKFYDISNRKMLCSIRMFENVEDIAPSRDGRYLAVVSGGHAQVWELVYMLKEMKFTPMNPPILLFVCAWILCSSDPDASPEALLPRLLRELQDRGRGDIPAKFALMTLEGIRKGV